MRLVGVDIAISSIQVHAASVAETFSGAVIAGSVTKSSEAVTGSGALILVKVKDQQSLGTVSFVSGQRLYSIEEDILWARVWAMPTGVNAVIMDTFTERVKTQRKLREGDQILLLAAANIDNLFSVLASVTIFVKQ